MFQIDEDFIQQLLIRFGTNGQLDILQEECAELIKACSKIKRNTGGVKFIDCMDNLREELSHVAISSAVVASIYGITAEDIEIEVAKKRLKYNIL